MLFFDPVYFLFIIPGMLLAGWAQWRVKSAYAEASEIVSRSGLTGAQAANAVMQAENVDGVGIEPVDGYLSDHYDPRSKVLRLSPGVYANRSLAALGIAAHEAGHAIQDERHYGPLVIRNFLVPIAGFGSNFAFIVMIAGFLLSMASLIYAGIALFGASVLFQVVNLPVEFDASRRAKEALAMNGIIAPDEEATVARVLNAAALTYVAATLSSILVLLYYLYRSGLIGGSSDD